MRTYRVRQTLTLSGSLGRVALHLFAPIPLSTWCGAQTVRLVRAEPAGIERYVIPAVGLLYAAPILAGPGRPPPRVELEFIVEQRDPPPTGQRVSILTVTAPKTSVVEVEGGATGWLNPGAVETRIEAVPVPAAPDVPC